MARPTARIIKDVAGAPIMGIIAPKVHVNNTNISVIGDLVEGHGAYPHSGPVIATGSPNVFAHNSNVARLGDTASCGHQILKGSENTFTN
jgi:uncharacterized Zn-binding protein involved in type VI secretion